jgi:HrpA-like RNA helicase
MINGDTGTGKTTQVPQFILEEGMSAMRIIVYLWCVCVCVLSYW